MLIHHIGAKSVIERVTPVAWNAQGNGRFLIARRMEDRHLPKLVVRQLERLGQRVTLEPVAAETR
jgi:hypothetical protein